MKAAVLHKLGELPKYEDFDEPALANQNQLIITVKAASVKNLDKMRASGIHYASHTNLPAVVGVDGVGVLPDGRRIFASGLSGMMAEKAIIDKNNYTLLPDNMNDVTAAALPNAVFGAALALSYRAGMKKGEVVLINGATGVTGKAAVQIAKYYSAKKIIATGRNPESLKELELLGADEIISLKQNDEAITNRIKEIHSVTPINIVIDYTWGHPASLIMLALKGGGLHKVTSRVRFVTCGSIAGETIVLSSGTLRSSAIEILGSGIGSWPQEALDKVNTEILPEMMRLSAAGGLKIETVTAQLKDIETAWNEDVPAGKRLVIII